MKKLMSFHGVTGFILIALVCIPGILSAQVRVTRVNSPDYLNGKSGIVYTLPGTRMEVDLLILKTQEFAGPLAEFAGEFLGIDEVVTKNSISYALREASLCSYPEPDPGQVYLIEKEEKSQGEIWISFGKQAPVLTMERFEKGTSPSGFERWKEEIVTAPSGGNLFPKYTDSPDRDVVDTIIRRVSIDTLVIEEMTFKHSTVEYTNREKAEQAAERIRQIDHDRYNLLIGYQETGYPRETLEYMLEQLDRERSEYLKLFTGVRISETRSYRFDVFPNADREDQDYSLAGFSKSGGIVEADGQNDIVLSLLEGESDVLASALPEGMLSTGIVYRIPAMVKAVVSHQKKELISLRIGVLQLGYLQALPPQFKRIEFDLETGGLRSVVME